MATFQALLAHGGFTLNVPSSPAEVDAFIAKNHLTVKTKRHRREIAAACTWVQAHHNDMAGLMSCPLPLTPLLEALGLDKTLLSSAPGYTTLIRRVMAGVEAGKSPKKPKPSKAGRPKRASAESAGAAKKGKAGVKPAPPPPSPSDSDQSSSDSDGGSDVSDYRKKARKSKRPRDDSSDGDGSAIDVDADAEGSGSRGKGSRKLSAKGAAAGYSAAKKLRASSPAGSDGGYGSARSISSLVKESTLSPADTVIDLATAAMGGKAPGDEPPPRLYRLAEDWPNLRSSTLRSGLDTRWKGTLDRRSRWSHSEMTKYDHGHAHKSSVPETLGNPAWVHRASLEFTDSNLAELTLLGKTLALVAKGEWESDYFKHDHVGANDLLSFRAFRDQLRVFYSNCETASLMGRPIALGDVNGFLSVFQTGFSRRFRLMWRMFHQPPAKSLTEFLARAEVLIHSARQEREIRDMGTAFRDRVSAEAVSSNAGPDYFWVRFSALYGEAVAVFLGAAERRSAAHASPPAPISALPAPTFGPVGATAGPMGAWPVPAQPPLGGTWAAQAAQVLAHPWGAQPIYTGGAPAAHSGPPPFLAAPAPAIPPPAYTPPAATPGATPAPAALGSQGGGGTGPTTRPPGPPPPAKVKTEPRFVGTPAHPVVCGPRAVAALTAALASRPPAARSLGRACSCQLLGGSDAARHCSWDCPQRYFELYGSCPGWASGSARDPGCWVGDEITDATRTQWKQFIAAHGLVPSRATAGLPPANFD